MRTVNTFDKILLIILFLFSCWFMWKSFSYDAKTHEFIIARNVVGDFGLHLSLIRSFSWGNNIPVESPFYPGVPLPYHYGVDLAAGLLERAGVRIDVALNGLSAIAYTLLLYCIYLLPQRIFGKNRFVGIVSVFLFVFHSSQTFVDFFAGKSISFSLVKNIWVLPNYIHAGPFDWSQISTFFTPNVFANQRHLVVGLAISLWLVYWLWPFVMGKKHQFGHFIWAGVVLGILGWVHTLIFLGTSLVIGLLCLVRKRWKLLVPLLLPAAIIVAPRVWVILLSGLRSHPIWNPGFLASRPLTAYSFFTYWWVNLGAAMIAVPFGVFITGKGRRQLFWAATVLFIIANTFQLSYRIDHNHSLLNFWIIIADFYAAYALYYLWSKKTMGKITAVVAFAVLTASGILDMMAVKNDYRLRFTDAPKNIFMQWIRTSTPPDAVFFAKQELLDPVTLAGRKNYIGHDYYLSVMGYDYADRANSANVKNTEQLKNEGVDYIVLPKDTPWQDEAGPVYRGDTMTVYKL